MTDVISYYNLPYSSKPEGSIHLETEELVRFSMTELHDMMNSEEYTKKTRFYA